MREHKRRVVITGAGVVSPVGVGLTQFWSRLSAGVSGVTEVRDFDTSEFGCHHGGEVQDFSAADFFPPSRARRWDRCTQFAMVATQEALAQAGMPSGPPDGDRAAVIVGTAAGGRREAIRFQRDVLLANGNRARAARRFPRSQMLNASYHAQANRLAAEFGFRGPNVTISTACASGTNAVALGADLVRFGRADVALAGGAELLCQIVFTGFAAIRAMSEEGKIRPFDGARQGLMLGEGAGMLVLEEQDAALARGATILAEVAGWGLSGDAVHMTAPARHGEGLAAAIRMALDDAGLEPDAVDYINAHGTGTRYNDQMETRAFKAVFGDLAYRIPVSSTKSMLGHQLGAAGSIEAVVALLAIQHGLIPPTINYETPDPECDLDYVPNTARRARVRTVLSTSAGFAGNNAALLLVAPAASAARAAA